MIRHGLLAGLVAAALALVASLVAWTDPALPSVSAPHAAEDVWSMPQASRFDPDEALSTILQAHVWSDPAFAPLLPTVEPPLTPPDWRISGVYLADGQKFALLRQDGAAEVTLKIGDELPGKFKILDITSDWIVIQMHGKRRAISTYRE